jgi:transcriptional regulator with XRE-family HTH domain
MRRMSTIGERVRALRKKRGYSQVELAALAGITQGSLSLIERNETAVPAGGTLAGLCRALQTTPDFLIAGGGGDPESIESAMQEHELVYLWRSLPPAARRLVLDNANAVRQAFPPTAAAKQPQKDPP